ncbi:xanthine dehydrogenase family protein molybdopterin-binding subunit [Saccharopolyspora sp. TS4A08]|uniref:Xanthine dehydrogenase family protein molybdopterin-binding subunit n=1 Tax=Saccharopolyspora ipomoeae TaxID=3042027 RepID=A0ABT6PIL5_9PSEU|nr:xanthine dehydrogenase family protein molybdopterin-binding subunit [Saccharopolyspora sp. TS4A08]MDI2027844.1 xanthine dehydrogenase family protein molybdopterin-binding subunit [Saccharopolyspora sp. TS4A08]
MQTSEHGSPTLLGASTRRIEDDRLLTGRARFIADVVLPGMVEVAFVRSDVPHARVRGIDTGAAAESPGVHAVFGGAEVDLAAVPDRMPWVRPVGHVPLARDRVRYVGCPLAVVVADDRYLAEDAAELVEADLEPLPVVGTADQALADDAPLLYPEWGDNLLLSVEPDTAQVDAAFAELRTVSGTYEIRRHSAVPLEGRGVVAEYRDGRLTVWTSTQAAFVVRGMLSAVLGLPERDIRVITPDVGGGFGQKNEIYPEEYLIPWLAMRLRRPVRWIEDRHEHLVAATHARDTTIRLSAAVREDGTIAALRGRVRTDLGSGEIFPAGYGPSLVAVGSLCGPYRIPQQAIAVQGVVTNKTPTGGYRGFGGPEGTFAIERLVDRIAREVGVDRLELRRRMILDPQDLPYETAAGARLRSGTHREAFERAVVLGERMLAEERTNAGAAALLGVGYATYVEGVASTTFSITGTWSSQDSADVRFDADGGVTVAVGVSAMGQGAHTTVATLVAEALTIPIEQVRVVMGDTDTAPFGLGSWASRGALVAGGAIERAAEVLRRKGTDIAAHLLEAAPEDLELTGGRFQVRGSPGSAVPWSRVAQSALNRTFELPPGVDPGLEARAVYEPPGLDHVPRPDGKMNAAAGYTNATHAAVVRVDAETGVVEVLRYAVVHDCGRVINPLTLAGQIHGGVAQGIGGALHEHLPYEDGQPLATSFAEYLLPGTGEVPEMVVEELGGPAPETPFGVKGAGEAGIIGAPAAIAGAVEHALGVSGVDVTPLTPSVVRGLVEGARS